MKNHPMHLKVAPNLTECPEDVRDALGRMLESRNVTAGLLTVASTFRFDGVSHFLLGDRSNVSPPTAHWTSSGKNWALLYQKFALHRVDPRLTNTAGRLYPLVWDGESDKPDTQMKEFLVRAQPVGIRSGVAISIVDPRVGRAVITWDSAISPVSAERSLSINRSLGSIALLTAILFESLLANNVLVPHRTLPRSPLTCREQESLRLAACGMTSADISIKLGITERTANFHIGNVIAKLNALNRGEAIARAITLGWISHSR